MEAIEGPNQNCRFVEIFLERHPTRQTVEKLVHVAFNEFDQFVADHRIFVSG